MNPLEYVTFWITVFAYALGSAIALTGLVFKREQFLAAATFACTSGLVAHLVAIGARVVHTARFELTAQF